MEIIGKISKGTKMDQIYLPKNRYGFNPGEYVVITPIEIKKNSEKLYFYNIKNIEPFKLKIIEETFDIIDKSIEKYENFLITGSFLNKGFNFNDIDIIIVSDKQININNIKRIIESRIGIKSHIILLNNKTLMKGLSLDPLYQMMINQCVSKKRFIYKTAHKIDYKILDFHLLKSKILIKNFDILTGNEKYTLTRNLIAIYLYSHFKMISSIIVDNEIKKLFNLKNINEIKQNLLNKNNFIKKYKFLYEKTFNKIMEGIKNGSK